MTTRSHHVLHRWPQDLSEAFRRFLRELEEAFAELRSRLDQNGNRFNRNGPGLLRTLIVVAAIVFTALAIEIGVQAWLRFGP
jgi:hypothetical protein